MFDHPCRRPADAGLVSKVRRRTALLLSAAALTASAALPAAASAGLLTGLLGGGGTTGPLLYVLDDLVDNLLIGHTALSADDCTEPTVSQPFASYGDNANYFLVDGGDFSAATYGWQARDGAIEGGVMELPVPTAVAVSPKVCVGETEPTMRLRYASRGYSPRLRVDALFLGTRGELRSDYVTTLTGAQAMAPSPIIDLGTNERAASGEKTAIALVFTVQRGAWEIDDVYVDPFRSR